MTIDYFGVLVDKQQRAKVHDMILYKQVHGTFFEGTCQLQRKYQILFLFRVWAEEEGAHPSRFSFITTLPALQRWSFCRISSLSSLSLSSLL